MFLYRANVNLVNRNTGYEEGFYDVCVFQKKNEYTFICEDPEGLVFLLRKAYKDIENKMKKWDCYRASKRIQTVIDQYIKDPYAIKDNELLLFLNNNAIVYPCNFMEAQIFSIREDECYC